MIYKPQLNLKYLLFFVFVIFTQINCSFAQDTLILKNRFDYIVQNKSGQQLKFKNLKEAAKAEELPEAAKYFRRAQTWDIVGKIFGYPGAFLFGYQLGLALNPNGNVEPIVLLTSVGMLTTQVALILSLRDPNLKKGAKIYNEAAHKKRMQME
jgi:hypothetical protein